MQKGQVLWSPGPEWLWAAAAAPAASRTADSTNAIMARLEQLNPFIECVQSRLPGTGVTGARGDYTTPAMLLLL